MRVPTSPRGLWRVRQFYRSDLIFSVKLENALSESRFFAPKRRAPMLSKNAVDAEVDDIAQREFPGRRRKKLQRVARHRAIMPGAFDRVLQGAMLVHRRNRGLEIAIPDFAPLQGAAPELALLRRP